MGRKLRISGWVAGPLAVAAAVGAFLAVASHDLHWTHGTTLVVAAALVALLGLLGTPLLVAGLLLAESDAHASKTIESPVPVTDDRELPYINRVNSMMSTIALAQHTKMRNLPAVAEGADYIRSVIFTQRVSSVDTARTDAARRAFVDADTELRRVPEDENVRVLKLISRAGLADTEWSESNQLLELSPPSDGRKRLANTLAQPLQLSIIN